MKIKRLGAPKVIMSNPDSIHNYFAWPTVARLQNGSIAIVASGYRLSHICPFGKTVMSISTDEGENYTQPEAVFDTVLDDRDGGICTFGESGVVVTSFNNTVAFQRNFLKGDTADYRLKYLETISPEAENEALGSGVRFSNDCGKTFGPVIHVPVSAPHGPISLHNGTLLYIGRALQGTGKVECHVLYTNGTTEYLSTLPEAEGWFMCEPHAIELKNGDILCHIRGQKKENGKYTALTTFQSRSVDGGKTWSPLKQLLGDKEGTPPHLMRHSSGMLICSYADRYSKGEQGIRVMVSSDEGESWDVGYRIYDNAVSWDLGYPSTVELKDGSFLTAFYAHEQAGQPAVIMQQRWMFFE